MKTLLLLALIVIQIQTSLGATVPLGRVWERVDPQDGIQANRFCKVGDSVYAVGNSGAVWTTNDSQTWIPEETFISDHLNGVTSGNGTLVAVGAGGRIIRKTSGSVWGEQPSGVNVTLRAVTYGGGQFVAVGDGGTVIRSADGVSWAVWPSGFTSNLYDVIWDGVKFRTVGLNNRIASALPGGIWVNHVQPTNHPSDNRSITVQNGRYVINGTKFSTNGEVWSIAATGISGNDVAASDAVIVSVRNQGTVAVSSDGTQWTSIQTGSKENLIAVEWTGDQFLAMTTARTFITSTDGYRWRSRGLSGGPVVHMDGCWTGSQYVVVSSSQNFYTSPDGLSWTTEIVPPHGPMSAVCIGGGTLVAVGGDMSILYSSDGRNWQKVIIGGSWGFTDVHWTGAEFIAVGNDGVTLTSTNGSSWKMNCPGRLDAVVWDGNRFVAFSGRNILQSPNGNDWLPLASVDWPVISTFPSETINDLIWTGSEYLAVGTSGWTLRSTDGLKWTSGTFGATISIGDLYAVTWSGNRFVTVGKDSFGYSDNGLNWTFTRQPDRFFFADVAWNGSIFMAVRGKSVISSPNGIDWTLRHTRTGGVLRSIIWDGAQWVMAGNAAPTTFASDKALIATSPDGTTWTTVDGDAGSTFVAATSNGAVTAVIDSKGKIKSNALGAWVDEAPGLIGDPVTVLSGNGGFQAFSSYGMTSRRMNDATWQVGDRRVNDELIRTIVSANGIWVAGGNTSILTSLDGRNWTNQTVGGGYEGPFAASVWTGSKFQIVGEITVYESSTGFDWKPQVKTSWSSRDMNSIVRYNNQTFLGGYRSLSPPVFILKENGDSFSQVVAGNATVLSLIAGPSSVIAIGQGETLISRDGVSWAGLEPRLQLPGNLTDVIQTPLGYFAASGGGSVWQSPDGENWNRRQASEIITLAALAWGNSRLVGVGSDLLHSSDGVQWNKASISAGSTLFTDVAWGGGRYVAVQNGGTAFSSDGITWQRVVAGTDFKSVVWTGSHFCAGSSDGAVLRSTDGSSWSYITLPNNLVSAASGNGTRLVSSSNGSLFRSTTSENWEISFNPRDSGIYDSGGKVVFISGKFFYFLTSATFYSEDGNSWTRSTQRFRDIVWTGSEFVGVDDRGRSGRSSDGVAWNITIRPERSDSPSSAVWTGSQIITVGSLGSAHSSPDGAVWTPLTTGTTRNLVDVVWTGTQAVALGSNNSLVFFASGPALPAGILARDLFVDGGTLMVACDSGKIARLDGDTWTITDTGSGPNLNSISNWMTGHFAVGDSGTMLVSKSEQSVNTWTLAARSAKSATNTVTALQAADGKMISLSSDGRINTSTTGQIWNLFAAPTTRQLNSVTAVDGDLIAVGDAGQIFRIFPNGSFMPENGKASTASLKAITSSGNRLVIVGDNGLIILSKSGNDLTYGYDRWSADQGSTAIPLEPGNDFDQDGIKNIVEYVFGFSSSSNESSRLPRVVMSPDGPFLNFEMFTSFQDADLRIQRTNDFILWMDISRKIGAGSWSGSARVTESVASGGRTRIAVVDQSPTQNSKVFYRVEIKRR